jgi:hypothetical protein
MLGAGFDTLIPDKPAMVIRTLEILEAYFSHDLSPNDKSTEVKMIGKPCSCWKYVFRMLFSFDYSALAQIPHVRLPILALILMGADPRMSVTFGPKVKQRKTCLIQAYYRILRITAQQISVRP